MCFWAFWHWLVGLSHFYLRKVVNNIVVSGRIFYISMTISVLLTLVVSVAPFHVSPSLFQIGVLSLYLLVGARRSLLFRTTNHNFIYDKLLAVTVVIVSLVVMLYSVVTFGDFHPQRTVFGLIGIGFGSIDLWLFRSAKNTKPEVVGITFIKNDRGIYCSCNRLLCCSKILGWLL